MSYNYQSSNNTSDTTSNTTNTTDTTTSNNNNSDKIYIVKSNGGKYYLNDIEKPIINLEVNKIYTFDLSDSSTNGHPFYITTTNPGGQNAINNKYDVGVVTNGNHNGTSVKTVTFTVSSNVPITLYYHCGIHANMGNKINIIKEQINNNNRVIINNSNNNDSNNINNNINYVDIINEFSNDGIFSNLHLKGNISFNNINYNLNKNNILIKNNNLVDNIIRKLHNYESGYNFILNSDKNSIQLILPNNSNIGTYFNIYINTNIKSLEIIPYNLLLNKSSDKIIGSYVMSNSNNYSISSFEYKDIQHPHKLQASNKIQLQNNSQGILKGGVLSIHCIDNLINNVEGLTFINITNNSAVLIWNSPLNLYEHKLSNIPDITYNIYELKNDEWFLLKKNYKNKFYNINNISTNSIIIKVTTNNNENGLIIKLKLPNNNNQYKISYIYDNINSEKIWLINGNLNGEFNDVKNDFEPIFK